MSNALFATLYLADITLLIFCFTSSFKKCFGGGEGATLIFNRKLWVTEIFLSKFFKQAAALGDSTWNVKSDPFLTKQTGINVWLEPFVKLARTISFSNLAALLRVILCQPCDKVLKKITFFQSYILKLVHFTSWGFELWLGKMFFLCSKD